MQKRHAVGGAQHRYFLCPTTLAVLFLLPPPLVDGVSVQFNVDLGNGEALAIEVEMLKTGGIGGRGQQREMQQRGQSLVRL
mgnify:FL=1